MKHYLHISCYCSFNPDGYSISDAILVVDGNTLSEIREKVSTQLRSVVQSSGRTLNGQPNIISITELSKELYEMLNGDKDGVKESQLEPQESSN